MTPEVHLDVLADLREVAFAFYGSEKLVHWLHALSHIEVPIFKVDLLVGELLRRSDDALEEQVEQVGKDLIPLYTLHR